MTDPEQKGDEPTVREEPTPEKTQSVWRRGLARLRKVFTTPLGQLFRGRPLSEEVFEELEEALLAADVGVQTTSALIERLRERCRKEKPQDASELRTYLKDEMLAILTKQPNRPLVGSEHPWVILMIGVNGVGKTTSIAKLTSRFGREGKNVLLVAADTFRAAAIEQLEVWAGRLGVELIKHQSGASPAAVAFDGIRAAIARKSDIVIIDTAGRLHTKAPLMEELKKVHRVIARELPGAPHEVLLVLDASTGQNALSQAGTFQQIAPLTGVILSKMDGSAKGGMALSVVERLSVPIRYVGLGEKEEDLQDFSPENFIDALFSVADGEA
ncbi:MAG: signal recognition particle-docking protein FtsY [Deltaproteobacteria bacterium]|nr:signal recognition particle-docking protein FtsY [Deltaproteobacteria bacterium]